MLMVFIQCEDARRAILLAEELWNDGITTYVPNLAEFQQLVSPRPREEWDELHMEYLRRSDALLADSGDCEIPVEVATELGLPVFSTLQDIFRFAREGSDG